MNCRLMLLLSRRRGVHSKLNLHYSNMVSCPQGSLNFSVSLSLLLRGPINIKFCDRISVRFRDSNVGRSRPFTRAPHTRRIRKAKLI